ncbi:MAG: SIR2 family protein [Planctomycetota bacterium]
MGSTNRFLLTGAGFTHNFGGPLATQLWAMIFNHPRVQASPSLRSQFLDNFDFEDVYYSVMEDEHLSDARDGLDVAVSEAYDAIDATVRDFTFRTGSPFPVNIYKVQNLIAAFSGTSSDPGFFFTLNQDLFVERHYYNGPRPVLPAIQLHGQWFGGNSSAPLTETDYCQVPAENELKQEKSKFTTGHEFCYLKLHGSCNWRSSGGSRQMVIGRGKEGKIQREPLLAWYFDVFREVISKGNRRGLVIGYGFADKHVNDVLAEAVVKHGLRLSVVSPESPSSFHEGLLGKHRGQEIWTGLGAYYECSLAQLFPADQSESSLWGAMRREFFAGVPLPQ